MNLPTLESNREGRKERKEHVEALLGQATPGAEGGTAESVAQPRFLATSAAFAVINECQ
jgi:hypothetical protein